MLASENVEQPRCFENEIAFYSWRKVTALLSKYSQTTSRQDTLTSSMDNDFNPDQHPL